MYVYNNQHGFVGIFFLQFLAQIYGVTPGKALRHLDRHLPISSARHLTNCALGKSRHSLRCAAVRAPPSPQCRVSSRCPQPHWLQRGMAMKQHQGAATRAVPPSLDPRTHLLQLHVPLLPCHTHHMQHKTPAPAQPCPPRPRRFQLLWELPSPLPGITMK